MLDSSYSLRDVRPLPGLGWVAPGARLVRQIRQGLSYRHRHLSRITGRGIALNAVQIGDATFAQAMARGEISFGVHVFRGLPGDVFAATATPPDFQAMLFSLRWLQDFVASGNEVHRLLARTLVRKWAERISFKQPPEVMSRALISLSLAAPFLIGKGDSSFTEPFFALTERVIAQVAATKPRQLETRLVHAMALHYASLAFHTNTSLRHLANHRFNAVVDQVILADGGHCSRNPQALVQCLLDMIPLKTAMLVHNLEAPHALTAALERMIPMLRLLCHGDGRLSHFQGAGLEGKAEIKAILALDKTMGKPLNVAPHSGYCRIQHKSAAVIMDFGPSARCHGPLAFEFSDGHHRLLVNCGMPTSPAASWQKAAADIAAHNTMEVTGCETNTGLCSAEVRTSPQGSLIRSVRSIGHPQSYRHERNIFLSASGYDLRGEDCLSWPANESSAEVTLRFHLHPAVKTSLVRAGSKVVFLLPNRNAWNFVVSGAELDLEESISLAGAAPYRKSSQIVIRATLQNQTSIKWALRRIEKTASEAHTPQALELPF